jgi:hypothetical protein
VRHACASPPYTAAPLMPPRSALGPHGTPRVALWAPHLPRRVPRDVPGLALESAGEEAAPQQWPQPQPSAGHKLVLLPSQHTASPGRGLRARVCHQRQRPEQPTALHFAVGDALSDRGALLCLCHRKRNFSNSSMQLYSGARLAPFSCGCGLGTGLRHQDAGCT